MDFYILYSFLELGLDISPDTGDLFQLICRVLPFYLGFFLFKVYRKDGFTRFQYFNFLLALKKLKLKEKIYINLKLVGFFSEHYICTLYINTFYFSFIMTAWELYVYVLV